MNPPPEIRLIQSALEWEAALRVRVRVFVEEQGGPLSDEPDAWDNRARHWVVLDGGRVVGTARVYHPEPHLAKIGRVALLPETRGRGWGERLMRALLDWSDEHGFREAVLDAQAYAVPFYERLGFVAEGEEFLDAGIPHRRMRRKAG